jgi:hypothetical protein
MNKIQNGLRIRCRNATVVPPDDVDPSITGGLLVLLFPSSTGGTTTRAPLLVGTRMGGDGDVGVATGAAGFVVVRFLSVVVFRLGVILGGLAMVLLLLLTSEVTGAVVLLVFGTNDLDGTIVTLSLLPLLSKAHIIVAEAVVHIRCIHEVCVTERCSGTTFTIFTIEIDALDAVQQDRSGSCVPFFRGVV